jgi:hypothetical protein
MERRRALNNPIRAWPAVQQQNLNRGIAELFGPPARVIKDRRLIVCGPSLMGSFASLWARSSFFRKRAESNSLSSKAPERRHVYGAQPCEGILHLWARRAIDNQACGLPDYRKSLRKVRGE